MRTICRSTVVNILRRHGLDPKPRRGEETWGEFIKRHGQTLWACDFFTKNVWTMKGLVEVYVLFFINVGSRRVYLAGLMLNPERPWITQQARNFARCMKRGTAGQASHAISRPRPEVRAGVRHHFGSGPTRSLEHRPTALPLLIRPVRVVTRRRIRPAAVLPSFPGASQGQPPTGLFVDVLAPTRTCHFRRPCTGRATPPAVPSLRRTSPLALSAEERTNGRESKRDDSRQQFSSQQAPLPPTRAGKGVCVFEFSNVRRHPVRLAASVLPGPGFIDRERPPVTFTAVSGP